MHRLNIELMDREGALLRLLGTAERRGWRTVAVHAIGRLEGLQVDLGGIAKGYGVDRAADALEGIGGCLVNVGGDLAARGLRPGGHAPAPGPPRHRMGLRASSV